MNAYYLLTTQLKTYLLAEPDCNTVLRPQDLSDNKKDLFPVATIYISNSQMIRQTGAVRFSVEIQAVDIVDEPEDAQTDKFVKTDDFHDIMNAQFYVLARLFMQMERTAGYKIEATSPFEAIYLEQSPVLAGWSGSFTVTMDIGDITGC